MIRMTPVVFKSVHHRHELHRVRFNFRNGVWTFGRRLSDWAQFLVRVKGHLEPDCDNKFCERKWEDKENPDRKRRVYCFLCCCEACWDDGARHAYTGAGVSATRTIARRRNV